MKKKAIRARDHKYYWVFLLVSIVAPLIGLLVGLSFQFNKELLDRKVGLHMIVTSVLVVVISFLVGVIVGFASE